jgi:hypothetical protein
MATINLRKSTRGYQQAVEEYAEGSAQQEAIPLPSAPEHEWADYCNRARGKAAGAMIEWGRRIQEAHEAYKAQGQSWGRTWEDWCRDNLGIGKSFSNQLRVIGENLAISNGQILPAATDQLVMLARVRRDAPEVFDAAVAQGLVHPGMTRDEAKLLLAEARPSQPKATGKPRLRSIKLTAELVELLEQKAQQQGLSLVELLEEFALS